MANTTENKEISKEELIKVLGQARAWIACYHNTPGHDASSLCMTDVIDKVLKAEDETSK